MARVERWTIIPDFFVSELKYNRKGGDAYWYMEQSEEVEKENKSNVKEKLQ